MVFQHQDCGCGTRVRSAVEAPLTELRQGHLDAAPGIRICGDWPTPETTQLVLIKFRLLIKMHALHAFDPSFKDLSQKLVNSFFPGSSQSSCNRIFVLITRLSGHFLKDSYTVNVAQDTSVGFKLSNLRSPPRTQMYYGPSHNSKSCTTRITATVHARISPPHANSAFRENVVLCSLL